MLKKDFYIILDADSSGPKQFILQLNEKHSIYEGHFPGQPVVPGACFLQILKELIEVIIEKKIQLLKADELKFLIPVNPLTNNRLQANVNYSIDDRQQINVIANFKQNENICFKCRATFINQ
ncbi:MAG: 3-hydroxyacyl-ACP dehydratase [Ferruginibacter sp.]